ncbi:MAG: DUF3592 domain-containing protein [Magnetococcus sp. DMHC-8]
MEGIHALPLCTLLLVASVLLMIVGCYPFYRAHQSQSWPAIDGTIATAAASDTPCHREASSWLLCRTDIHYVYTVHNQSRMGKRIEFGWGDQSFLLKEFAARLTQRYPIGKQVRVYYNPDQPDDAVLERIPSMGGGFFLIVAGLFCLACHLRDRVRNRPE